MNRSLVITGENGEVTKKFVREEIEKEEST